MLVKGISLFIVIIIITNIFSTGIVFGEEQSEIDIRENGIVEEESEINIEDSFTEYLLDEIPVLEEITFSEEKVEKSIPDPEGGLERSLVEGTWGTVPWEYDPDSATITLFGGEGGSVGTAPWKLYTTVREIIVEEQVVLPINSSRLFQDLGNLEIIRNAGNFDVSGVRLMSLMFHNTPQLQVLDVSNWDTSLVTDMNAMFGLTGQLQMLDVSNWNVSNVVNMRGWLADSQLQSIDVSNWNTRNMNDLAAMFRGANRLQALDLSSWDVSHITNNNLLMNMLENTSKLKKLTLGEKSPFRSTVNLPAITPNDIYTGRWILQGSEANEGGPITFSSSQVFMEEYDGTYPGTYVWETTNIIRGTWGTVPWEYDPDSETITLFGGEGGTAATAPWKTYATVREIIVEEQVTLPVNSHYLFGELSHLEAVKDAGNLDVSGVKDMSFMFNGAQQLEVIDVSNWDTANVTSMRTMFQRVEQLEVLDVSSWDTSNVTDMSFMFNAARQLEVIDVSNWDTSNVTNMRCVFQSTESLKALDVSNWDTSNVTNMGWMFSHANQLEALDLSKWDTSNVTNMTNMLSRTNNLKKLVLGEHSLFTNVVNLPAIVQNEQYTGRWFLEGSDQNNGQKIAFNSSASFMEEYDGTYPGTYLWEEVSIDQLIAELDPVSDQSTSISGRMTEEADTQVITYKNTEGRTVTIEGTSSLVEWGAYQDEDQKVRAFKVRLQDGERLATDSKVSLFIDHISEFIDRSYETEKTVIKGLTFTASATTLSRQEVNRLENEEALFDLIIQESRAQAENVLTKEDMTDDFRVIETDLTVDTDQDGSYFAVLEVGNKAYQQTIRIDLTSKLDHMRVTIPTQMLFTSIYDEEESNRQFESETYEIRNHSSISVDTYINQVIVKDSAGIVLLEDGESPLDYLDMDSESDAEESTGLYQNITQPLLQLNLKTEETEIQLYENMIEKPLIQLPENSYVPLSLTGTFYGDYPRWVIDDTFDQGGYYEQSLTPNYRFILRFVPQE